MVLLNQTGLQHSILFLDSRLPFLSCKKYSSASGWQAINFLKCVRPRFSTPLYFSFYAQHVFFGGKDRGGNQGTDFNSCIRFFNSQIFSVTRFIHLLCSAAYAALLIVCRGWTALVQAAKAWNGQNQPPAGLVTSAALCLPQNTPTRQCCAESFMYGFGVLVRYKITSWGSYSRSPCNKCISASWLLKIENGRWFLLWNIENCLVPGRSDSKPHSFWMVRQ